MPTPRPKVFVCGTHSDLSSERGIILDTLRRLQLEYQSMELFGARPEQPIDTCLAEIRTSDIVIVIVGRRYGTPVPGGITSFSEAEYNEAIRLNKPCLVYVREDDPAAPLQSSVKSRLLEAWKARLKARHTIATFSDAGMLAVQVAIDLTRQLRKLEDTSPVSIERHQGGRPRLAVRPPRDEIDLADVLDDACDAILPAVRASDAMIRRLYDREKVFCRTDPKQLITAIGNLIDNAVKFSFQIKSAEPKAAWITVSLRGDNAVARIEVENWGLAITAEERETGSIFEHGERGEMTKRAKIPGTGMGLAVVRDIMNALGGSVTCDSRPARREYAPTDYKKPWITTFTLSLPRS